jgi:hypothetical protein
MVSDTKRDPFSVVLEPFLDDTFRRLAAKNQFSHCSKRNDNDAHNDSQHTVTNEQSEQHSNFKAPTRPNLLSAN